MSCSNTDNGIRKRNPLQIVAAMALDREISDGAYRYYYRLLYSAQQSEPGPIDYESLEKSQRYLKELEQAGYITCERRVDWPTIICIEDPANVERLKRLAARLEDAQRD